MNNNEEKLSQFRAQIDAIDDQIIALLEQRTGIVLNVGEYKRQTAAGICPIRPGREAQQLRRIVERFSTLNFSAAGAASIWRTIIGTSTSLESDLTLSVYSPERETDLCWMAREYFSAAAPLIRQPHIKRVIGDVIDGKAAVGIVPTIRGDDTSYWWTNLMGEGAPKVFAHIPFVLPAELDRMALSALAIAKLTPEPSGDDVSLLVIEAEHNVSQHRLQTAFGSAKLEANWLNIATLVPDTRHHLVSVRGFLPVESEQMQKVIAPLGSSVFSVNFLGAYATPVTLPTRKTETKAANHGA